MERESFDDDEAAQVLNGAFVCVKVDREERPDLDQYFMSACQALTGSGGWPLTIVMTPEKEPFFAGTYFPKTSRWGRPGILDLVPRIRELWEKRREEILRSAREITRSILSERAPGRNAEELDSAVFDEAGQQLAAEYDESHGGFGAAPKFPSPHNLTFLLRMWKRTGRPEALAMVEKTLSAMRSGGIFDQLGFGFHRYSTDARWRVPHFEKMLYDQAQLAGVYAEAYLATGKADFRRTALETLDYVLRDLTSPEGAFLSAEDADSEGEEGRFYLWTDEEIRGVLGREEAALAVETFNVRPEGNFNEPGRGPNGRNVLARTPPEDGRDISSGEKLERLRAKLYRAREKRVHPFKDRKILADWNGLAIAALSVAARITDDSRYLQAAQRAARFALDRMRGPDGRLFHVASDGEARVSGFLDDYAFLVHGLVELYQTAFDPEYLCEALSLAETARSLFWDGEHGGFFFVPPDSDLPSRKKELYDGAVPSGNSMMLMNLVRLARLTGRPDLEGMAREMILSFSPEIGAHPRAYTAFLCGLDFAFGPSSEVVVVGRRDDEGTRALLETLRTTYLPNVVVLFKPAEEKESRLGKIAPHTESMRAVDGRAAAYVCADGRCLEPVSSAEGLSRLLGP